MRSKNFGDYLDKKKREATRQLQILQKVLENAGMKVENFLKNEADEDPYIFCRSPIKSTSFDGIRVYKIGDQIAIRIQKESGTHPYGSAYSIPVEEMFHDFLSDKNVDELKAGKKVIEYIGKEVKRFFERCLRAEREERDRMLDQMGSGSGSIAASSQGTDYSSLVYSKGK